jgi:hypothetical protein
MAKTAKEWADQAKKDYDAGNLNDAAIAYYNAAAGYAQLGDSANADAMRAQEVNVLGQMAYEVLQDTASTMAGRALNLEGKAMAAADDGVYEGEDKGSTELYQKAAAYREQVADRYVALVKTLATSNLVQEAALHRGAARQADQAALDLEDAAADEPGTPAQQKEAKAQYARAAGLRRRAAAEHRAAAAIYKQIGDAANEAKQNKDAGRSDAKAGEDDAAAK